MSKRIIIFVLFHGYKSVVVFSQAKFSILESICSRCFVFSCVDILK